MNPIKAITRALGHRPGADPVTETRVKVTPSLRQQVWDAPATFNRKTRRAFGILSKVWRWDLNMAADTRRVFVPRYVRRHFKPNLMTHPRTRRERRHRARITRALAWKGTKP